MSDDEDDFYVPFDNLPAVRFSSFAGGTSGDRGSYRRSQMIVVATTNDQSASREELQKLTCKGEGEGGEEGSNLKDNCSLISSRLLISLLRAKEQCAVDSTLAFLRAEAEDNGSMHVSGGGMVGECSQKASYTGTRSPRIDDAVAGLARKRGMEIIKSIELNSKRNRPIPISGTGKRDDGNFFPNAFVETLCVHLCPDCHALRTTYSASSRWLAKDRRKGKKEKKKHREDNGDDDVSSATSSTSEREDSSTSSSSSSSSSTSSSSSNTAKRVVKERKRLLKEKKRLEKKRAKGQEKNPDLKGIMEDHTHNEERGDGDGEEEDDAENASAIRKINALRCPLHKRKIANFNCSTLKKDVSVLVHPLPTTSASASVRSGPYLAKMSHCVEFESDSVRGMVREVEALANAVLPPSGYTCSNTTAQEGSVIVSKREEPANKMRGHVDLLLPCQLVDGDEESRLNVVVNDCHGGEGISRDDDDNGGRVRASSISPARKSILEDVDDLFGDREGLATNLVSQMLFSGGTCTSGVSGRLRATLTGKGERGGSSHDNEVFELFSERLRVIAWSLREGLEDEGRRPFLQFPKKDDDRDPLTFESGSQNTFSVDFPELAETLRLLAKRSSSFEKKSTASAVHHHASSIFCASPRRQRLQQKAANPPPPLTLYHESSLVSYLTTGYLRENSSSSSSNRALSSTTSSSRTLHSSYRSYRRLVDGVIEGEEQEEEENDGACTSLLDVAIQLAHTIRARLKQTNNNNARSNNAINAATANDMTLGPTLASVFMNGCEGALIEVLLCLFYDFLSYCRHELALIVAGELRWDRVAIVSKSASEDYPANPPEDNPPRHQQDEGDAADNANREDEVVPATKIKGRPKGKKSGAVMHDGLQRNGETGQSSGGDAERVAKRREVDDVIAKQEATASFVWKIVEGLMDQLPLLTGLSVIFDAFMSFYAEDLVTYTAFSSSSSRLLFSRKDSVTHLIDGLASASVSTAMMASLLTFWRPSQPESMRCDNRGIGCDEAIKADNPKAQAAKKTKSEGAKVGRKGSSVTAEMSGAGGAHGVDDNKCDDAEEASLLLRVTEAPSPLPTLRRAREREIVTAESEAHNMCSKLASADHDQNCGIPAVDALLPRFFSFLAGNSDSNDDAGEDSEQSDKQKAAEAADEDEANTENNGRDTAESVASRHAQLRRLSALVSHNLTGTCTFAKSILEAATRTSITVAGRDETGEVLRKGKGKGAANKEKDNNNEAKNKDGANQQSAQQRYAWILEQHGKVDHLHFGGERRGEGEGERNSRMHADTIALLYKYRRGRKAVTKATAANDDSLFASTSESRDASHGLAVFTAHPSVATSTPFDTLSAARKIYEAKESVTETREKCASLRAELNEKMEEVKELLARFGGALDEATRAEASLVASVNEVAALETVGRECWIRCRSLTAYLPKGDAASASTATGGANANKKKTARKRSRN